MTSWLLLPDAWRIELMRRPLNREAWLNALAAYPDVKLLDWTSASPAPGELVLIAGLDLAAAELVLKLPPSVQVFAATTSWTLLPIGSRARLLQLACNRVNRHLDIYHHRRTLPLSPADYLGALLKAAGVGL
jgi:hypothetical protein